jgi:DNA-binding phage protein
MIKFEKKSPTNVVGHLNDVLRLDDPMTFQKVLLDLVLGQHELAEVSKRAGVRRETIWRYRAGTAHAPFGTLIKIIALLEARLVIIAG